MGNRSNQERAGAKRLDFEAQCNEAGGVFLGQQGQTRRHLHHAGVEEFLALHPLPGLPLLDRFEARAFVGRVLIEEPQIALENSDDVGIAKLAEDDRVR